MLLFRYKRVCLLSIIFFILGAGVIFFQFSSFSSSSHLSSQEDILKKIENNKDKDLILFALLAGLGTIILGIGGLIIDINLALNREKRNLFFNKLQTKPIVPPSLQNLLSIGTSVLVLYLILNITADHIKIPPPFSILVWNFLFYIISLGLIFRIVDINSIGWRKKAFLKNIPGLFKIFTGLFPLIMIVMVVNNLLKNNLKIEENLPLVSSLLLREKNPLVLIFLIFQIVVIAPIVEEIFFRGLLYSFLRKKYNFLFSALTSAFIFSAFHRTELHFLPILFLGLSFSYIYERTQNIFFPIGLHSLHNLTTTILIFSIKPLL